MFYRLRRRGRIVSQGKRHDGSLDFDQESYRNTVVSPLRSLERLIDERGRHFLSSLMTHSAMAIVVYLGVLSSRPLRNLQIFRRTRALQPYAFHLTIRTLHASSSQLSSV
ncbi:hypothetical protein SCHPADRAFT_572741 [Schizopora paradoxa]|uniref:Uncharacterized protein n=1 Tax=Schizopora paradoxa TaxID=27342 RepID=A0A0H2RBS9_9AGAM|nr:hypothetical protein SCHPADRAFT_572741 [Schizopora paradoxa]